MKRMWFLIGCLAVLISAVNGAVFAEDLLIGTAYFLDENGEVITPYGAEEALREKLPVVLLIEAEVENDEEEGAAVIYYQLGDGPRIEEGIIKRPDIGYYISEGVFEIEAPELGRIRFAHSGEVLADEIWAEIASYRVQALGEWYTAVGVIAFEEFQETDEEREAFLEITGDLKEDLQDGQEQ